MHAILLLEGKQLNLLGEKRISSYNHMFGGVELQKQLQKDLFVKLHFGGTCLTVCSNVH